MEVKTFLKQHLKTILSLLLIGVFIYLLSLAYKAVEERTMIIGDPDSIVVISPDESQDVIVIGDTEKLNVKPTNKNKK